MTRALTARLLRFAGVTVALLVVLCCATSVARASCGDAYVVTRSAHHGDVAAPGQHPIETPSPLPARPHKPCNGPNCSGGPVEPPLSVPTVTSPTPPEWGSLTGGPAFAPPRDVSRFSDDSASHPVSVALSIFHPPRPTA
jgi:hypothetical protein